MNSLCEEKIDDEFVKLIQNLDDDIFWTYIRSWKDEITIEFFDEDGVYGKIETKEENFEKIEGLLEEFRNKDTEMYNIDDFFSFLTEREVNFQTIKIEADKRVRF